MKELPLVSVITSFSTFIDSKRDATSIVFPDASIVLSDAMPTPMSDVTLSVTHRSIASVSVSGASESNGSWSTSLVSGAPPSG